MSDYIEILEDAADVIGGLKKGVQSYGNFRQPAFEMLASLNKRGKQQKTKNAQEKPKEKQKEKAADAGKKKRKKKGAAGTGKKGGKAQPDTGDQMRAAKKEAAGTPVYEAETDRRSSMDLKEAVVWSEILGEPVCRKRRRKRVDEMGYPFRSLAAASAVQEERAEQQYGD